MTDLERFEQVEMDRRLSNVISLGTIQEVDTGKARVRVQTGDILTDWLPWVSTRAATVSIWNPPQVGEQVVLLAPSGELAQAVVLPGIFQQSLPAPSQSPVKHLVKYPDGTVAEYDFETHTLTVSSVGDVIINAAQVVTVNAQTINLVGGAAINLSAPTIGITGSMALDGDGNWTGNITHTEGSLSSNGVVLHTHTHGGVQTGGGSTGGPN